MIIKFRNTYLQNLFEGNVVKGKAKFSNDVITKLKKTILKLQYAESTKEIKLIRGLNFEALKGNLKGYYSVRVDYYYRVILSLEKDESVIIKEIIIIEDLTNHYQ